MSFFQQQRDEESAYCAGRSGNQDVHDEISPFGRMSVHLVLIWAEWGCSQARRAKGGVPVHGEGGDTVLARRVGTRRHPRHTRGKAPPEPSEEAVEPGAERGSQDRRHQIDPQVLGPAA